MCVRALSALFTGHFTAWMRCYMTGDAEWFASTLEITHMLQGKK